VRAREGEEVREQGGSRRGAREPGSQGERDARPGESARGQRAGADSEWKKTST
jgi:hypothetical protein